MQVVTENRLIWKDPDWAAYLGCSVAEVAQYRNILNGLFSTGVAFNKTTGMYCFVMYKYEETPSGSKRPLLLYSGKKGFSSAEDAARNANNNIISKPTFVLTDFWANQYGVPAPSLQMLLINQR